MSSSINQVRFDPTGKTNNYQEINPLHPLQQNGPFDISRFVYEIVTKDFGYQGAEKYTLTLKNSEMVLEIWERPDGSAKRHFGKIEWKNEQWVLISAATNTSSTLPNQQAVSKRLTDTLDRISQVYHQQRPSATPVATIVGTIKTYERNHLRKAWQEEELAQYRKLSQTLKDTQAMTDQMSQQLKNSDRSITHFL